MDEKSARIAELAAKPAGEDQIARARELCTSYPDLLEQFEAFIKTRPTRGQMVSYLENLKEGGSSKALESVAVSICHGLGISDPSPSERLLAIQVGLLQEQSRALNELLKKTSPQSNAGKASSGGVTGLLAGVIIGSLLQ